MSDRMELLEGFPPQLHLTSLPDETLMERLQSGDSDALAVLFVRYHRLVLNVATRILRDSGEAEDLMQSVFLEILRSAAQFDRMRGTVRVWILQYAYHRSFNRRHYLSLRGLFGHSEGFESGTKLKRQSPERPSGVMESAGAMREALGYLNSAQRTTLELAFYEGLTIQEIARTTGMSFDSVKHNYYRALRKLRFILTGPCEMGSCSRPPQQIQGRAIPPAPGEAVPLGIRSAALNPPSARMMSSGSHSPSEILSSHAG